MNLTQNTPPSGTIRDWVDHRAAENGVAFVFPEDGTTLRWRDLRNDAARTAALLGAHGVAKGESIAIMHPNGPEAVIVLFAALYGGFRATMINLAAGRDAVAYALRHSDARVAFVHSSARGLFDQAKPCDIQVMELPKHDVHATLYHVDANDDALLMYTSGTTGTPKGVMHTQASLLAGGWTTAIAHKLGPDDCGFCVLPMYHINGLCVSIMGALVSGGTIAMCSRFSASQFWGTVEAAHATWLSIVPTIISHLLHGDHDPDAETNARLRFARSASAPLAPEVHKAFETRFGVPIIETMGLTETAAQILSNPLPPATRKIGSPGIAYGNEVCILTSHLDPCAPGVEGEIAVRGPNVMAKYFKNPEATRNSFAHGWLRTGDLGKQDKDGYVFVTGRLKEVIIKGGENIAPREIDDALYSHPDVIEAAAFARNCPSYGERVEAAVTLRVGSTVSARDLIALCVARVGAFKSPDKVHILEELPKGPSGKIQRLKIADITINA